MDHDEGEKLLGEKLRHPEIEVLWRMQLQGFFFNASHVSPSNFSPDFDATRRQLEMGSLTPRRMNLVF